MRPGAPVFTNNTSGVLIVGYLVALTWWGVRLAAHTLRLAFPRVSATIRRLMNGAAAS